MSGPRQTLEPEYFDALYASDPDPWNFAASPYEQGKYALTIQALPKPRYHSALEVGCSIGVLTRLLASRCDTILAIDAARTPLIEAKHRCADLPSVCFEQMFVPEEWPNAVFDLILLSEVVYYLSREDVDRLAARVTRSLAPRRRRDPCPLDRLDRLSPKWRRGCRPLHRTNGIDMHRRAVGSIFPFSPGRVVAPLSRLCEGGRANDARLISVQAIRPVSAIAAQTTGFDPR